MKGGVKLDAPGAEGGAGIVRKVEFRLKTAAPVVDGDQRERESRLQGVAGPAVVGAGSAGIVVGDGAGGRGRAERGTRGAGESQAESFVRLHGFIADDRDRDGLAGFARGEDEGSAVRNVIAAGGGRAVGGGVIDADGTCQRAGQGDGEVERGGAEVTLADAATGDVQDGGGAAGGVEPLGEGGRKVRLRSVFVADFPTADAADHRAARKHGFGSWITSALIFRFIASGGVNHSPSIKTSSELASMAAL